MDHDVVLTDKLPYHYRYPHPAVTTDCVVFGYDGAQLRVLLIRRAQEPCKDRWAFPGGFLNPDETAEVGAARELEEETGLRGAHIEQFHAFSDPGRDPRDRVITIAFYAVVPLHAVCGADDAADARWFPLDSLPPLAFDHDQMFRLAVRALRRAAVFAPLGRGILAETFTIAELQTFYTAIFGRPVCGKKLRDAMNRHGLLHVVATSAEERFAFDAARYDEAEAAGFFLAL